jgi:hypothetical protein
MDRATNSTAPADRLFCAVELSKNSWLLGIQFPDREKASVYPLKGGDSEVGQVLPFVGALFDLQSWSADASKAALCGHLRRPPIQVSLPLDSGHATDPLAELRSVPQAGACVAASSVAWLLK